MSTTLWVWFWICVAILVAGIIFSCLNSTGEAFAFAFIVSACIASVVFLIYGHTFTISTSVEEVKEFAVTRHPNYVLLSTPQGETFSINDLKSLRIFEETGKLYRQYRTNHYGNLFSTEILLEP